MVNKDHRSSRVRQSTSSMQSSRSSHKSMRNSRVGGQSRKTFAQSDAQSAQKITVKDDDGNDVTPLSLLGVKAAASAAAGGDQSGAVSPKSETSEVIESHQSYSRSGWSSGTVSPGLGEEDAAADGAALEGAPKEEEDGEEDTRRMPDEVVLPPTTEELELPVSFNLSETPTIWLLDIAGDKVGDEYPEVDAVRAENTKYEKALKARVGNDKYVSRGAQTLNPLLKTKESYMPPSQMKDSGCQSSAWDIHDVSASAQESSTVNEGDALGGSGTRRKVASGGDSLESSESLAASLRLVERLVTQNVFHDRHMMYRGMTAPSGEGEANRRLEKLWSFNCDITNGRTVSAMCWNSVRQDVLAVAFGQFEFADQKEGLIVFWSLKNPEYPERTIKNPVGVTSLAFSTKSPHLLAAGCHDGTIYVYDVSKTDGSCLKSTYADGKHGDAVWDLQWVDRGTERGESLVSVSTDGRVTQWSIKKGLEHSDLMKLKRVASKGGHGDAFISRNASGTSIDFYQHDPNLYLVGTEDGNIHKCSCSYNEQYLDTFQGHSGPVYRVAWSPHHANVFASCSADWSVRVWHQEYSAPLLVAQPSTEPVFDIVWSPRCSTVMATTCRDGMLGVWDLSTSLLDPVTSVKLPFHPTRVLFGSTSPVLLAGDSNGSVHVYRMVGLEGVGGTEEEQRKRLDTALAAKDGVE